MPTKEKKVKAVPTTGGNTWQIGSCGRRPTIQTPRIFVGMRSALIWQWCLCSVRRLHDEGAVRMVLRTGDHCDQARSR